MPVREKYSQNVGLWQTEVGQLNEVVHLWAYRDLNERAAVRGQGHRRIPSGRPSSARPRRCSLDMQFVVLIPAPSSPMK